MSHDSWILCVSVGIVFILTPGPSMLLICSRSIEIGPRYTMYSILGNVTAISVSSLCIAGGLSVVLQASEVLLYTVRLLGCGYLVYLGFRMLLSGASPSVMSPKDFRAVSGLKLFSEGFFVSIGNPKTFLFLTSCFSLTIDLRLPAVSQIALFIATFVCFSFFSLTFYALVASRIGQLFGVRSYLGWVRRIFGGFFIGSGISLALPERK